MLMTPSVPPPAELPGTAHPEEDGLVIGAGFDFTDPNSPLARFYCRNSHVVAAAMLALVFVLLNYVHLWYTDIWGHLQFGRWIVANGALPAGDPSCAFAEEDPVALTYAWLSQAGLYLVYHTGE